MPFFPLYIPGLKHVKIYRMGKIRLIYIVIVFMKLGAVSYASSTDHKILKKDCQNLDIRDSSPKLKKHFSTPRDQAGMGWCYGFTAADLLTAELGVPVSSAHVATIYNDKLATSLVFRAKTTNLSSFISRSLGKDNIYEGGRSNLAVEKVSHFGKICLESTIPYNGYGWEKVSEVVKELELLKASLDNKSKTSRSEVCSSITEFLRKNPFRDTSAAELYETLLNYNLNTAFNKIVTEHCDTNLVDVGKIKVKKLKIKEQKQFFKNTVDQLKKGKPVEFSYDIKHIADFSGFHSSLFIAMKWDNNKCQFKVRNSWGSGCDSYDPDKIESCNSKEGSYWISDERYYEMVKNISFITN